MARLLEGRQIISMHVDCVSNVSIGNHGDVAFQFGATVIVETRKITIRFEVSIDEVLCRTDSVDLIKATILERLTKGMKVTATKRLHMFTDRDGKYQCSFGVLPVDAILEKYKGISWVPLYVTGDLVFYAMALGKESSLGSWCYLCKLCCSKYADPEHVNGERWTLDELVDLGQKIADKAMKSTMSIKTHLGGHSSTLSTLSSHCFTP